MADDASRSPTLEPSERGTDSLALPWADRLPRDEPRPWRRFWARQIDYLILGYLLGVTAALLAPGLLTDDGAARGNWFWSIVTAFIWVFAESGFLWSTGTTPGKWTLGIRVVAPDGTRPSFRRAFQRSSGVFVNGVGLGIPFVGIFTMLHGYNTLRDGGSLRWERSSGLRAVDGPVGAARLAVAIAVPALILGLIAWSEFLEDPWKEQARGAVVDLRDWMTEKAAEREIAVDALGGLRFGEAVQGDVRREPLQIPSAGWYAVVGGCDESCMDLDISIVTPWGDELGADREISADPVVYLATDAPERLELEIEMVRCNLEPCIYAWQLLKADASLRFITQSRSGTCFAVHPMGLVMTAHHLVEDAENISVRFGWGGPLPARILQSVAEYDLALLEVDQRTPAYLGLADEGELRLGQRIFTMGFPATEFLGEGVKFSEGSVASLSGPKGQDQFFQMSVAIQPGSSGGPVVDESGRVVGVVSSTVEHHRFEEATGALPQALNWAAKVGGARLLFSQPPSPPPVDDRSDAIRRVQQAVCFLEAQ